LLDISGGTSAFFTRPGFPSAANGAFPAKWASARRIGRDRQGADIIRRMKEVYSRSSEN
jgi:hypothetical protein